MCNEDRTSLFIDSIKMNIKIRPEKEQDYKKIEQIGTATVFLLTSKGEMVIFFIYAKNSKNCSKRISPSCHPKR